MAVSRKAGSEVPVPFGDDMCSFTIFGGDNEHLVKNKEKNKDRKLLTRTKALEGRGQPGLAAFYKDSEGKEWLIKEDQAETCLLEGSAYFAQPEIPPRYESCISFARLGTLKSGAGAEEKTISVQRKVENAIPLDIILLGHKRNPKTWVSE